MNTIWKPKTWITISLGIFAQSFAFLYLNRAYLFFIYLTIAIPIASYDTSKHTYYYYVFILISTLHATYLSKFKTTENPRKWYSHWWGIIICIFFLFAPISLLRSFLYEPYSIPNSSMTPNLNKGDFVIVKKWGFGNYGTYGLTFWHPGLSEENKLLRTHIYVFIQPDKNIPYVKRLIGLPGDNIRIEQNDIYINEKKIDSVKIEEDELIETWKESFEGKTYLTNIQKKMPQDSFQNVIVPNNEYYFLGDTRNNSFDSRYWGTVPSENMVGEVIYVYHPE